MDELQRHARDAMNVLAVAAIVLLSFMATGAHDPSAERDLLGVKITRNGAPELVSLAMAGAYLYLTAVCSAMIARPRQIERNPAWLFAFPGWEAALLGHVWLLIGPVIFVAGWFIALAHREWVLYDPEHSPITYCVVPALLAFALFCLSLRAAACARQVRALFLE